MDQYLLFALLGMGAGAVFAGLGMGLVTVYKGSGVVNFAQASLGLWGAFVFDELRKTGDLVLPVLVIPGRVHLGTSTPLPVAVAVGLLSSAALGALVHVLVFRPLRNAPALSKIMASVGILTLLQSLLVRRFGSGSRVVDSVLGSDSLRFAGVELPLDRLWLLGITVVVSCALVAYYRWSMAGLATRAGVEDEVALLLARWSPNRLASLNWALGSGVTSLFLLLASPITGLNPASIGTLVVPGLAALLVARLSSVAVAAVAGLGLGVLQSELSFMQLQSWWPRSLPSGTTDAIPFVVIVIALVLLGKKLPRRGELVLSRLPAVVRRPLRLKWVLIGTAAVALLAPLLGQAQRNGLIASMVFAVIALSYVVLVGLVGQVSLGQAAIAGVSAFTLARATDGLPFPVSVLLSALTATLVGVVMGAPALRIRGAQLAVVTLAGAVAVEALFLRQISAGGSELADPKLFGLDLAAQRASELARLPFTYAVLAALVLCCLLVSRVLNGTTGRRFLAVRSNERAAAAVGVDVARTKLIAFALSSFIAGVGGALLAYSRGSVSIESFNYLAGISFLIFAFIGGITSVGGALLAGLIGPFGLWYVVLDGLVPLGSAYDILGGLTMISTAIVAPEGAASFYGKALRKLLARRTGPAGHAGKVPAPADTPAAAVPSVDALAPTPPTAAERRSGPALEVERVSVRYGGVRAVQDVSLVVRAGELHGLIGPNGAGKTSTLDAIAGFCVSEGAVRVRGTDVSRLPPHRRFGAGLARTWQATELFLDLTVRDNLLVAAQPGSPGDLINDVVGRARVSKDDAMSALRLLGIGHLADSHPAELSTGQQKLVGVARALAARPAVLLCDEPAAGLDSAESRELGRHLRAVADTGVAVVLIEHDLSLVLQMCDEVTVLDFGQVIAQGPPEAIRRDPAVMTAYVGDTRPVNSVSKEVQP
ncbi:ABC-type branched-subunit amino acid transport system ATPase component/ABC-type branched-subunit amino acid transport system permease subunit [Streptomyces sp. SAI-135]|uniref:branched-chain amino acid ABC transporter permease/ATP-binding protein n=1 Tax=unclassified Streptomyces TaxID=2593676 RepID=UPI002474B9F4|nr:MULTISPECIES: branched-chain amino acid ABC transporter permease/ATP-binding protein [unclassified Streptomyces]MDH6522923.1 ABC-type branched-subunit amino acid transport system ATPase component/ABC-type branched-subunit amino acid transport system permease subunit [Streptomyces sp. SAI-090]MDH6613463.1 ABC-type branched-subunit amino acid transport system ATPase component/ABC-type branched-subunit amino acid transport system permease subunit [Streptomyces sp. SAI-135]